MAVTVQPYDPAHMCRACGAEGGIPLRHGRPVLAVFGTGPQYPCAGQDGSLGAHLCVRCESCGHRWTEETMPDVLP